MRVSVEVDAVRRAVNDRLREIIKKVACLSEAPWQLVRDQLYPTMRRDINSLVDAFMLLAPNKGQFTKNAFLNSKPSSVDHRILPLLCLGLYAEAADELEAILNEHNLLM